MKYFILLNPEVNLHEKNFMAIFTTLSVVICFSMGTLGIFTTLVYVFTMCVVIYDILNMAVIPILATSIMFCNLCYIHGENFMTIFTTLSVVIWFSTGTLGIFATLVYVFTIRVVIYDILSMAIIPTLSDFHTVM